MELKKKEIKVTFGDINKNNYEHLRQLNNLSLPVKYQNGFYQRILAKLRFGKFAYVNDIIVGDITWKYDIFENQKNVYIMTISVLEDYKRFNIGSQLLNELINIHRNVKQIKYINLHVQVNNQSALNFYLKHNFENVRTIENYYTDIEPRDAYYLKLQLNQ